MEGEGGGWRVEGGGWRVEGGGEGGVEGEGGEWRVEGITTTHNYTQLLDYILHVIVEVCEVS